MIKKLKNKTNQIKITFNFKVFKIMSFQIKIKISKGKCLFKRNFKIIILNLKTF